MSALYGMELAWPYGGHEVFVVGSWSGWREREQLGADGRVRLQLPRGFHTYKFVVDGRWCYDVLKPRATDDCGNVNNVLCVPRGEAAVETLPLACGRARAALWAAQREACVRALAKRRPAVVCTQRGLRDQLAYLCQRAGPYRRTGLPEDGSSDGSDSDGEHCAVLWDAEQLLHVASGDFWLSAQPHVPGSRFAGAPAARMATWALLRPYYSGEPALLVCSTALEGGAAAAALRARQAAVLAAQLARVVAAVRSGDIRDPGSQAPVDLAAVVVAGQFGEPVCGGSGGCAGSVYSLLAREGYCDCVREARCVALPFVPGTPGARDIEALRRAAEDWLLVRKCADAAAPAGTPAPVSWTPAARTDVAELFVAVDKTGTAPGCQQGALPLCATLVVTELPRPRHPLRVSPPGL